MAASIYLDYAAATPLAPEVLAAMQPYLARDFYNPSSPYLAAKTVRNAIEDARARVAHWLGAKPAEVIFTAGATESINLAIRGVMEQYPKAKCIMSGIEHQAVLCAARDYAWVTAPVKADGLIDLETLERLIDDHTVLLNVGYANNEVGTIQPMGRIAGLVREVRRLRQLKNNPLPLYVHTDASQAACYLDLHASRLGADLITLNGGKIYGPKQTGVLFVRAGVALKPQIAGGGQEMGLRSGTENVPGIIGFATALDISQTQRKVAIIKTSALRDELQQLIVAALPRTIINGNQKKRLPNNLHLSWPGVDGERLLMRLDQAGLMASTGSACAANKGTASHVLKAMGLGEAAIQGSLRLTLGRSTTQKQIKRAAQLIVRFVADQ